MPEKPLSELSRAETLALPRLHPAPRRAEDGGAPAAPAAVTGHLTIDQYLALRGVPEHRRASRRAFAGAKVVGTVEEFDRLFAGVRGAR